MPKFLFMIALLRHNKVYNSNKKVFEYSDRNAITLDTIGTNLLHLCKIAYMHCMGLITIREYLQPMYEQGWYDYYRNRFCIKAHVWDDERGLGDLQLNNILRSHKLFLRRQSTYDGYDFINDHIREQYMILETNYKKIVQSIINNKEIVLNNDYFIKLINFKAFINNG